MCVTKFHQTKLDMTLRAITMTPRQANIPRK